MNSHKSIFQIDRLYKSHIFNAKNFSGGGGSTRASDKGWVTLFKLNVTLNFKNKII